MLVKALNATILDGQKSARSNIAERFTLRRSAFILNTVKIERGNFATKENLRAGVGIDRTRDILAKFEDGGTKTPREGSSIAIPVGARRRTSGSEYALRAAASRSSRFRSVYLRMDSRTALSLCSLQRFARPIAPSTGFGQS